MSWLLVIPNISQNKTFFLNCNVGSGKRGHARHKPIMLVDWLSKSMQSGIHTYLILLDFSKATDKVAYKKLLLKLHLNGLRENIINWIKDFLDNRMQSALLNGKNSYNIAVSSGVPHGSVLRPILFLPTLTTSRNRLDPKSGYSQTTQPCILLLISKLIQSSYRKT